MRQIRAFQPLLFDDFPQTKALFGGNFIMSEISSCRSLGNLLETFERDYFSERGKTAEVRTTWDREYRRVFQHLDRSEPPTEEILKQVILRTEPNTRQRRRYTIAIAKLADYAGIEHNLRRLIGKYSKKRVNPRVIPTDEQIFDAWTKIDNLSWAWVYGMMAVYGLRNCEVFRLDWSRFPELLVESAKGGDWRLVFPLYPEWVNEFKLRSHLIPNCTGKCNTDFGQRVTKALKREGIPFAPYNLRHAWARRSIEFGWDVSLAASQMGHSVKVHTEIYHLWLTGDVYKRTYERLLARPDRPTAPGSLIGLSLLTNSHSEEKGNDPRPADTSVGGKPDER
jgi:hypothetical protein